MQYTFLINALITISDGIAELKKAILNINFVDWESKLKPVAETLLSIYTLLYNYAEK